ncbi:MAG: hypothetical protein HQ472_05900 [Ignavibacteria bacterium]|nr:hypothetical protein [Ignavibacteria bacterium]
MNKRRQLITLGLLLGVTLSSLSFLGCDAINAAATFKIPITVTVRPTGVNPTLPTTNISCEDLSTNTDFSDNKDKIKSGNVKEAFFQIERLDDPIFTSGVIADQVFTVCTFVMVFDPIYGDMKEYQLGTFTNISMQDLITSRMPITLNSDIVAAIGLIPSRPKFCFKATYGPLVSGPASASFIGGKLDVVLDFTASAL